MLKTIYTPNYYVMKATYPNAFCIRKVGSNWQGVIEVVA